VLVLPRPLSRASRLTRRPRARRQSSRPAPTARSESWPPAC